MRKGKYVYWFIVRGENPRGFGFADLRVYFSNLKKAKRHQDQNKTTMYDSRTGRTKITKPKMHRQLRGTLRKGVHIN